MTIMDIIKGIGRKMGSREVEEYGDYETKDKYLRSLRRERRIQLEQQEKKRLKAQIEAYNKRQREEHLWGYRNNILQQGKKKRYTKRVKERWLQK